MKNVEAMRTKIFAKMLFVVTITCISGVVFGEETYWAGNGGDWFNPANWRYDVPASNYTAYIDNGGMATMSYGSSTFEGRLYVGNTTSGRIYQTGGALAPGETRIGNDFTGIGIYSLSGSGILNTGNFIVGYVGVGTFNQSGGTNNNTWLFVGNEYASQGTYNLSGTGTLRTTNDQYVGQAGHYGGSVGQFVQTGGQNIVGGKLVIGDQLGATGSYSMSGGDLKAQRLLVGNFGRGRFELNSSSANVEISDKLIFSELGEFAAQSGSIIHLKGASLDNWSKQENNLAGFNSVTLSFEGGTDGLVKTLEIASRDMGATAAGFEMNFALDTLGLSGVQPAHVQLVDWRENSVGTEALYVKNLILGKDTNLDLNGYNIYYQTLTNAGGNVDFNGGSLVQIPEPTTISLLVIGGLALLKRRA